MWKQRERLHCTSARTAWDKDFFYSGMYPPNLTVEYIDTDSPENQQYEKDIKYTFNEYGFRSDSFYDRSDLNILTCGCSMTVGVGVDQHETWTERLKHKIAEHTGKSVTAWNLATSGASTDYVARTLWKMDDVLRPDFVFVYWPPISRLELPDEVQPGKIVEVGLNDPTFPKFLVDEDYLVFNFQKNLHFMQSHFNKNRASFVCNEVMETVVQIVTKKESVSFDTSGRDGMHPGPEWHDKLAGIYLKEIINKLTR